MPQKTALQFNKEIIFGECGSLLMAYGAAYLAAHFTRHPAIISGSAVAGTLAGGTLFWLAARIHHRKAGRQWSLRDLAGDISYFTPAAITLGFIVYDPAIYLVSHAMLTSGAAVGWSVAAGQAVAFSLFLGGMNAYRAVLLKTSGKRL